MKKKNNFKKYIVTIWALFIALVSSVFGIFYFASVGGLGEMPDLKVLENPKTNLASEILSEEGKTIAKFYFNDNRTPVNFSEFPQHLVAALLATEDIRFYSHSGIDWISTLRAIVKLGKDGGRSTITQQ